MKYSSKSYTLFTIANYIFLALLSATCIAPLLHLLALSLSSKAPANANLVGFWPVGFTTAAYYETFGNQNFIRASIISLLRSVVGPVFSMIVTTMGAYSLSKEHAQFKSRNVYMWFFVFAMLFNGGLIPTYMVVRSIGLMNSFWVLILPIAVSVFNMILLLNFFRASVPKSVEEAAFIDGANHIRTLFFIYLPLAVPALATITLFNIIIHWNSYFDGLIYMTDSKNHPLATFLLTIVVSENANPLGMVNNIKNISESTLKASQIFLSLIPILLVYPFLQRYFIKGIIMGSVKE
ncbi:carbohydrate ABC transporter permease [Cohnella silvisoli]|uniref:Carbohydrate ABC transporter permease n=1 Tax=Cohnella silvisoli TaxID=2873699 RepID=A0ABV1KQL1_9BACL|nr:carbohydrate ABC transporter permease [Cohnella silvisoli]MCD9024650.1 carbohydrate ABC transporter permease [Cohnella silvisoli]